MKKLILVCLISFSACVLASDGTLDPAFGAGLGYVLNPAGTDIVSIAVQTDGKLVAIGPRTPISPIFTQVVRYNTDGTLDNSFGAGGIVTQLSVAPGDLIIQPDGKILVLGMNSITTDFTLIRYNIDGSLDTTFGTGGIAIFPASQVGNGNQITLQADGKIVTAGRDSSGLILQVLRFTSSGMLDTVFQTVAILSGSPNGLVIQEDGKIVAGAISITAQLQLSRYNVDGTVDTSYGLGGVATTSIPGVSFGGGTSAIILQQDGKIIISGWSTPTGPVVARFDTMGFLDPSFGNASFGVPGVFQAAPSGSVTSLVLQADSKVILSGTSSTGTNFQIERITSNGAVDTSWNGTGFTNAPLGNSIASTIQSNGYFIAAGSDIAHALFEVARYISSPIFSPTAITAPAQNSTITPGIVTITGSAQGPALVYIFIDNVFVGGTQTNGNSWSFSTLLTTGSHIIQAVSIYQDKKLNIASNLLAITVATPVPPTPNCVIPAFTNVSALVQSIVNKYCCRI